MNLFLIALGIALVAYLIYRILRPDEVSTHLLDVIESIEIGRYEDAQDHLLNATNAAVNLAENDPRKLMLLLEHARLCSLNADDAESLELLERVLQLTSNRGKSYNSIRARALLNSAEVLERLDRNDLAETAYDDALDMRIATYGADAPETDMVLLKYVKFLYKIGCQDKAETLMRKRRGHD